MSISQNIVGQFKQPHGVLGQVAGYIMATRSSNIERNEWTLELLGLKPQDNLLEVGFGPGIAIEKAAKIVTQGLIIGVDHSEAMLQQARKRNAAAIRRDAVRLYLGTVETLPVFDMTFDKIYSSNVVQFWSDPVATLRKLRGLLTPGGRIATTYMPRHSGATHADTLEKARTITSYLEDAGYSSIRIEEKQTKPVSSVSVLGANHVA
jgi:ubiquinone/menaquinone biosynthesis C-methylase UbiE